MLENSAVLVLVSSYLVVLVDFLTPFIRVAIYLFLGVLFLWFLFQLIRWVVFLFSLRGPFSFLELQPLRKTEISPLTTQQLYTVIHGLARPHSWPYRFFNLAKAYAFEITSSKAHGIRYIVRVPKQDVRLVRQTLISYLPGLQVKVAPDDISPVTKNLRITAYRLSRHFAYPLLHQETLVNHDPIAYITGTMTKLLPGEVIAFQLVLSPLQKSSVSAVAQISELIYSGKNLVGTLGSGQTRWFYRLLKYCLQLLLLPLGLMVFVVTTGREGPLLTLGGEKINSKTPNPYQTELEALIKHKLGQPLFRASIRLMVASASSREISQRTRSFTSALTSFNNADYQAIVPVRKINLPFIANIHRWLFFHRVTFPSSIQILSAAEIADLYHLPFTQTTKTEDLTKQAAKDLPAPLSLKQTGTLDLVFAQNRYGGHLTPIGLTQDERRRHLYILGATGTGKSTLLLSMLKQDLEHNRGLCLIDPHGDLVDQVLSLIPTSRIKDVVYFNPDDISYPMGINLLELTPGLDEEAAVREKEFIAESIISVFNKIYTEKYSGPRMEYILRNTIHTAFTVPDATLFTIYKLLINTGYRKSVVMNLKDENLKDFWKYEFAKAGDYQKVKMISPITNKIGRFLFSPTAKRILEQGKSTISFESIINDGKILLCNLSKGKIGEDNSSVFGVLIMAKIQLAALKRARIKPADRKDFYLYVDEFQNFATPAFAQILSEARKYRLNAILAHQTTSQIETNSLVNVTLANTGTVICFRTANPEDERVILPQFRPYVELGEIAGLPSFHFYMRLGALNPEEPFSGVTTPIKVDSNPSQIEAVIASSRALYTKPYVPPKTLSSVTVKKPAFKRGYALLP